MFERFDIDNPVNVKEQAREWRAFTNKFRSTGNLISRVISCALQTRKYYTRTKTTRYAAIDRSAASNLRQLLNLYSVCVWT